MELRDYVKVLRRRWRIMLACVVAVVALAVAYTASVTPQYASQVRLYVSSAQSNTSEALASGQLSQQRIASYADMIQGQEIAEAVVDELNLDISAGEVASKVSASVTPATVIMNITVLDPDPAVAQAIAQAYGMQMTEVIRQLETPPGKTVSPIKATIFEPASKPGQPVSPDPVRNLGIALIAGLVLGIAAAFLRETLDTSISSPTELAEVTDAPLLGSVAFDTNIRGRPVITALDSHAPRVESFRVLRTNLQFVDVDNPDKVFVVTSAIPDEGKSSTSVNLAVAMAQAGHRTLLIEGDLRRPKATMTLGLDYSVGATNVLLGKVSLDDAIQRHAESDLHVLASGTIPPNPAELLQSNAMADLLKRVRSDYDVVIIDAPPLLPVTDAALLSAQADGVLLVVRHGKTTKDQVAQAVDRLQQVDASLVGVVLNMVPNKRRNTGSGYGYGYGYAPEKSTT